MSAITAESQVRIMYPDARCVRNYLEGGWFIADIGVFGDGLTEEEAWEDAARRMLAAALTK